MSLTVGTLSGVLSIDSSRWRRGLSNAQDGMARLQVETVARLALMRHQFGEAGRDSARAFNRGLRGGLRRIGPAILNVGKAMVRFGGRASKSLVPVVAAFGMMAAAAGTVIPVIASLAAAIGALAPAAGAAASAMLAIKMVSGTIKLAMHGVKDAITAAMDPSDPEAFAEALKKLSPEARKFAVAVQGLQGKFKSLQQSVQNAVFKDFDSVVKSLAGSVLPVLQKNLVVTGETLNLMAKSASKAATKLAKSGVLGQAMASANNALAKLQNSPGKVVTALGQVAAAGGPAFNRLAESAAGALDSITQKMGTAFKSGAMEQAISQAVDLLYDLGDILGNIGTIFGNVFGAAQAGGGGLIVTLKEITGVLADVTGTTGFQEALKALFGVMGTLAKTVGPLLGKALEAIGPVLTALGPPVERLIKSLGEALGPIIEALGPILGVAAKAVGSLLNALTPLLPPIGKLISSLLPVLTPFLKLLSQQFAAVAPLVMKLANILMSALMPIISALMPVVGTLAKVLGGALRQALPIVASLFQTLAPALQSVGTLVVALLKAVSPLIELLGILVGGALKLLAPILNVIAKVVAKVAGLLANYLAKYINNIVVPAVQALVALFHGDFSKAWDLVKKVVKGAVTTVLSLFGDLPAKAGHALASLGSWLWKVGKAGLHKLTSAVTNGVSTALDWLGGLPRRAFNALGRLGSYLYNAARSGAARLVSAISSKVRSAIDYVRGLPGRAARALYGIGSKLYNSGKSLIQGFINGIRNMIGRAKDAVGSVVGAVRDFFPFSPAKTGPFSGKGWTLYSGRALIDGLSQGIAQRKLALASAVSQAVGAAQKAIPQRLSGLATAPGTNWTPAAATGAGGGFAAHAVSDRTRALMIQNYYESEGGSAKDTAEELDWIARVRG